MLKHVALLSLVWSCAQNGDFRPTGDTPMAGDSDKGDAVIGQCPDSSQSYSLTPPANLPEVAEISLPEPLPAVTLVPAGEGEANSVRLSVCMDGGAPTLSAVLHLAQSFSVPRLFIRDDTVSAPQEDFVEIGEGFVHRIRLPPGNFMVEGLAAALAGDLSGLVIRLVGETGWVAAGGEGFVAVAQGRVTLTSVQYTSVFVTVGGLAPGDVFAARVCGFGEESAQASFSMATADFDVEMCTFMGGGFTTGYQITYLAVQDSSPELSAAEQERFELIGEAEVESVMTYAWNHHNACDSFHLALAHADYAATAAPAAGCGPTVANAPERDISEPDDSPVKFRIRYHGGAWVDGEMVGCRHYLWCGR